MDGLNAETVEDEGCVCERDEKGRINLHEA